MFQNPILFPQVTNRESWVQTVQIYDDDTGDLVALVDSGGNALFGVNLEIRPPRSHGYYGVTASPYYDSGCGEAIIYATLAQGSPAIVAGAYIALADSGTISIQIPKTVMQTLRRAEIYDVFLTIDDTVNDDARQILIGKLPVMFGGQNT